MANYNGTFRSSYFKVNNEQALRDLVLHNGAELFERVEHPDVFGFGGYMSIPGVPKPETKDGEVEYESIIPYIQNLLPDGEVVVLTEVGNENLRYLLGYCVVFTNSKIESIELSDWAVKQAKKMGKNHIDMNY